MLIMNQRCCFHFFVVVNIIDLTRFEVQQILNAFMFSLGDKLLYNWYNYLAGI